MITWCMAHPWMTFCMVCLLLLIIDDIFNFDIHIVKDTRKIDKLEKELNNKK